MDDNKRLKRSAWRRLAEGKQSSMWAGSLELVPKPRPSTSGWSLRDFSYLQHGWIEHLCPRSECSGHRTNQPRFTSGLIYITNLRSVSRLPHISSSFRRPRFDVGGWSYLTVETWRKWFFFLLVIRGHCTLSRPVVSFAWALPSKWEIKNPPPPAAFRSVAALSRPRSPNNNFSCHCWDVVFQEGRVSLLEFLAKPLFVLRGVGGNGERRLEIYRSQVHNLHLVLKPT